MKTALVIALCLTAGAASAQTADSTQPQQPTTGNPQHFAQAKNKRLAHISARLDALQKMQACVQASTDIASMRACNQLGDK